VIRLVVAAASLLLLYNCWPIAADGGFFADALLLCCFRKLLLV